MISDYFKFFGKEEEQKKQYVKLYSKIFKAQCDRKRIHVVANNDVSDIINGADYLKKDKQSIENNEIEGKENEDDKYR